jgi:hypothetical protein
MKKLTYVLFASIILAALAGCETSNETDISSFTQEMPDENGPGNKTLSRTTTPQGHSGKSKNMAVNPSGLAKPAFSPTLIVLPEVMPEQIREIANILAQNGVIVREKIGDRVLVVECASLNQALISLPGVLFITDPNWGDPLWDEMDGALGLQAMWANYYSRNGLVKRSGSLTGNSLPEPETRTLVDASGDYERSDSTSETWGSRGHGQEKAVEWRTPENSRLIDAYAPAPGYYETSEFMIGSTTVGVIFVDGPTAKWSAGGKTTALSEISAGANWYAGFRPQANISFNVVSYSTTVSTNPTAGSGTATAWRYQALQNLGYAGSHDGFFDMNNALRDAYDTDWAYVVLMVTDGTLGNSTTFTDGYFAFAYMNGPYQVHTDDNNGWGLSRLDQVFAHETGHSFGAMDEYCQPGYSCCSCSGNYGYLNIQNTNCAAGCPEGACGGVEPSCASCASCIEVTCMMRENNWSMCPVSQFQLGWRDTDGDSIYDPVDTTPTVTLTPFTPDPTSNARPAYSGSATEPMTEIVLVEYSVSGCVTTGWTAATASDGAFDEPSEAFTFTPQLAPGSCTVSVRSKNTWGNYSTTASDSVVVDCTTADQACKAPGSFNGTTCVTSNLPDGTVCNDGNLCTQTDVCAAGTCTGSNLFVCDAPDQCQNAGTCNPATGQCVFPAKTNGTACDADSNGCTVGDSCSSGVCMRGLEADCSAFADKCVLGACSSTSNTTYECYADSTAMNGWQCNDLVTCTENDACLNGVCGGIPVRCDDSLACTDDTCEVGAATAFVSGGSAFENISVTGTDTGIVGDDVAAGPYPVGFTFPFGQANSKTQFWVNSNGLILFDGANTAYGNFNIPNDNAPNNFIAPYWEDLTCLTANACKIKYKTIGTGVSAHLVVQWTNIAVLDNGAKITLQAVLFTDGTIEFRYETVQAGANGAFATVGVEYAGGTSGIEHSFNTAFITSGLKLTLAPVASCRNTLQADKCIINGTCLARDEVNPSNRCQKCNPDLIVEAWSFNDGAACDLDSNGCTRDTCSSGTCSAGLAPDCTAMDDQCNTGKCNSTGDLTYECVKNPTPKQGLLCNADSTGCTVDDKCNAGSCVAGSAADCSALDDQCNTGVCYSLTNNTYACSTDSAPHEGAACDSDGSGCTIDDTCAGGFCLAGAEPDCSAWDDQCNTGICYSLTSNTFACSTNSTPHDGNACDSDGSGCTVDDTCSGGFCLAGAEPDCSALDDQCNTGVCYSLTINTYACSTDPTLKEGAACDLDGNGCTVDDTCSGGFCLAGAEADCSAWDDQCNTGVCQSLTDNTYACSTDSTPHDGAACDMDGSGCTVDDTCLGGFCLAGAEPDCSAMDDPCNTGICSSTGNNTHECLKDPGPNEGLMCEADSNGCTVDDECRAGECIPGAAPDCSAEDDQCNTGACQSVNASTYLCYKNAAPLHLKPCNADSDGCTANDMCNSGTCVTGNAVDCSARDDQCNTGLCNSTGNNAHECLGNPAPHEGAACNSDGSGCTVDDACVLGSCVAGSAPDCSAEDDQCNVGVCNSTGALTYECLKNWESFQYMTCDADNDGCTIGDACRFGTCQPGPRWDCLLDEDQCNAAFCNSTGAYRHECIKDPTPKEGALCNSDGYGCTVDDTCVLGSCVAGDSPDCTMEDDQCNVGYCSSISDNTFECLKNSEPKLGQLCNSDSFGCTVNDACVLGECIAGDSPDCTMEDDQCNTGICNSTGADTYECLKNPAPMEGALCNSDGYGCTVDDACVLGACLAGSAPDCSAEDDQCNTGICDSTGADTYECLKNPAPREGLLCNSDDDGCTFEDACVLGSCVTGAPFDCSGDDDQCNIGVCNSVGANEFICVKNPEPLEGELCNDADLCSVNSTCTSGQCEGTAKVCSDDFACTQNYCDQDTGDCTSTATDSSCDDSNLCTVDVCSRTDGCLNTATPDWSSCSDDDDYACFTGTCETLAVNDTCPKATALTEGEPKHIAAVGYHAYLTIPEACLGREVSGPDGFYSFVPTTGSTYTVSITTDAGTTVTAARWSACGESAECLYASDVDGEKIIEWTPDAPDGTVFLQVVVTGCEGECTTPGYTVTVTEVVRPGDEASDAGADEAFADEAADISEGVTTDTTSDVIEITDDVVIGTDLTVTDVARPDVRHDSASDSTIGHDAFADSSNTDDGTQPTPGSSGCSASPTGFASQALVICLLCFGTFFMLRLRRRNARL